MKIGILSMQRIHNHGSFLQAYALMKILEQKGHIVSFVDIDFSAARKQTPVKAKRLKRYLTKIRYLDRYFFKRIAYSKRNKLQDKMFIEVQGKYLGVWGSAQDASGCDAVLIGSDEIFNCDSQSVWGITSQRFGDIPGIHFTFSYAASCGYTSVHDVAPDDREVIRDALRKLRAISVRDQNTYEFVKYFTNLKPHLNLDPVLMFDFKDEMEKAIEERPLDNKYMVVYAYHNRIESSKEIQAIKGYARKNGLKTISIGGSLAWCDDFAVINPFQVLVYFKNACCVVTDTFHGCVIAAKFNKPLGVLVRDSNRNKLEDLLKRLHLEMHRINEMDELEQVLNMPEDYGLCNDIILKERGHMEKYLNTVLYLE